ncbi:ribonuclease H-like domain-containing protein [Tanacetum coccineum]
MECRVSWLRRNAIIGCAVTGSTTISKGLVQANPTSLPPQPIGEATKASYLRRTTAEVQGRSHLTYFLYLIVQKCYDYSFSVMPRDSAVVGIDPELSRTVVVSTKLDTRIPEFARTLEFFLLHQHLCFMVSCLHTFQTSKYVRSGCTTALNVVPWETDGESVLREAMTNTQTPPHATTVVIPTGAPATNTVANHAERPEKFNGQNFKRWQQKMFFYLTTLGLARFLKETVPQVEPPAEGQSSNAQAVQAVEAWKHSDFLCHNYVLNGLIDPLYNVYCKTTTAKELWESLERKYKTEDAGTKKFVVARFLDYKMVDSKNVISQVQDLQVLLHDIHAEGMTLSETFQVAAIIEKLPPSWVEFKNYLKHKRKEMSVEDLVVRLRIEEDNKLAQKDTYAPDSAKANMVEHAGSSSRSNSKGKGKDKKKNDKKGKGKSEYLAPKAGIVKQNASSQESLDSISNKLQKIVSQLAILGENISQEDLNFKFLRSLPSEWSMHVVVWRNKPDLGIISFDDLYNNFKIVEQEVKISSISSSNSSSQNVAYVSTPGSTNEDNTANVQDSTASTHVSTASTNNSTASLSDAIVAFDEAGFDWSFMADEEIPTNLALMAFSDSEYDSLRVELNKSEFDLATYKRGLASVEEQLVFYKKNEIKIDKFKNASKSLDKLIVSQISDNNRKGVVYNAVPPPPTGLFAPPTIDLSSSGLKEFQQPEFEGYGVNVNKSVSENSSNEIKKTNGAPIIEDWVSDCDEDESEVMVSNNVQHKSELKPEQAKQPRKISENPRNNRTNWNEKKTQKLGVGFQFTKKASVLTKSGIIPISTARQRCSKAAAPISAARPINTAAPKLFGDPQVALKDTGIFDSGCSKHMTGNKSFLTYYQDYNRGFVAFAGSSKGGRITGKGKIKTRKLDFEDVYFVKELKFNLFSVSQMCDKKNSVLFTKTECLILSPDFKLPDENQVMLKIPRKDNMYSFDLKNVVPSKGLTCLIAKATNDESNMWHRRLGHINFKTINKLVKGNLVRGLPSKIFENDHSCVACQKGKQHKASCKSKLVTSLNSPSSLSKRSPWLDIIREVTVLRTKCINLLDFIRKKVSSGLNTLFWEDRWLDDLALKHKLLRLYVLDKYKQITIVEKINQRWC